MYALETWLTCCGKKEAWWLLIRPSEITGRPFSMFGAETSICHIHLLSLYAPRAPTDALNQSFIRLYSSSSLMLQYTQASISPFHSLRSGSIMSVLHPSTNACRSTHRDVTESSKHKDYTQCQFRNLCRGAIIFRITILSIKNFNFNSMMLNLKHSSLKRNHHTCKLVIWCWLVWSQWR